MKCDELKPLVFSLNDLAYIDELMVQPNFQNPHDHAVYKATEVDAAIAELKQKLEDAKATAYAESVDAGMRERRLRRALWKLKALYFYRMFQWSMEGRRFAPEDDEPEDFFMECMGKHTKRKSEWGKEADMFDDARIVCIKKAEEFK